MTIDTTPGPAAGLAHRVGAGLAHQGRFGLVHGFGGVAALALRGSEPARHVHTLTLNRPGIVPVPARKEPT